MFVSFQFQLVLAVGEGSYQLAGGLPDINHALSLLLSDILVGQWSHLNPVFNADVNEFIFESSMLDQEFSNLVTKVIDDVLIILLSDLLEELLIQHGENFQLISCFLYNLVDTLSLHIDRFTTTHFK